MDHPECMYQSRMGSSNNDSNKGHNGGNMRQARDRELSLTTVTTLSDSGVENREGTAECGPCNCESMKRRGWLVGCLSISQYDQYMWGELESYRM